MEQKELLQEQEHLKETCSILNHKIQSMSDKIFEHQENVQEFGRYIWENKSDMDAQELMTVRATNEQDAKLLLDERTYFFKLKRIESSPYFASIDFAEADGLSKSI